MDFHCLTSIESTGSEAFLDDLTLEIIRAHLRESRLKHLTDRVEAVVVLLVLLRDLLAGVVHGLTFQNPLKLGRGGSAPGPKALRLERLFQLVCDRTACVYGSV